jgi:hypothetical protein
VPGLILGTRGTHMVREVLAVETEIDISLLAPVATLSLDELFAAVYQGALTDTGLEKLCVC